MKVFLPLLLAIALCAGCTSIAVRKPPGVDLNRYMHVFVEQPFNENHHVDELMVDELRRIGKDAHSGPMTMMPENTELVISYDARWTWDFKTYLIDLEVQVHTAHTKKKVAEGRYFQPSARPKPAEVVVQRLIPRMFGQ